MGNPPVPRVRSRQSAGSTQARADDARTSLSPMLTAQELAHLARIDVVTVRRLVRLGQLRAVKVGRALRISLADWQAYVAAHTVAPRPILPPQPTRTATPRDARATAAG